MKRLGVAVLALSLAACSNWPERGRGGYAERGDASHIPEASHVLHSRALEEQLTLYTLTLEVLALKGGRACVPAYLELAWRQQVRTARAIAAGMLDDAESDLVILSHRVEEASVRFDYLARRTDCTRTHTPVAESPVLPVSAGEEERRAMVQEKIVLLLNSHSQFATAASQLLPQYQEALALAAQLLAEQPARLIVVEGHTDSVGAEAANVALAERRANAVKDALIRKGVEAQVIRTQSRGEAAPLAPEVSDTARLANRRVTVSVEFAPVAGQTVARPSLPVKKWREIPALADRESR